MRHLDWGRRYLMCPPRHYGVLYEINPWMSREVPVDTDASSAQWEELRATLERLGAEIEIVEPVDGLPDMVFTANGGFVWDGTFVASHFKHRERADEARHFSRWASRAGLAVTGLHDDPVFEGAGDALPFRDRILAGYRIRSEFDAHTALAKALDVEVLSVELVDARFYHLDLTFCPLDDRRALVVPEAWDDYGRAVVSSLVAEPIALSSEEALAFCANSVVVGDAIVMPACTPRLRSELLDAGLDVHVTAVDQFLRAGGGVRCLTLALDVGGG